MEELKAELANLKAKNRQRQERIESLSAELVKTRKQRDALANGTTKAQRDHFSARVGKV